MSHAACLSVQDLVCAYGDRNIIQGISFDVHAGEIVSILGANGAGKSTLFKAILGQHPVKGSIRFFDKEAASFSAKERACHIGFVPQSHALAFPFIVQDVVVMGLAPWLGFFKIPGEAELHKARQALMRLDIAHLAELRFDQLSGGQQQLVLIARAIVGSPKVLLLDEPTASLDVGNAGKVIRQLLQLVREGMSVIMTTHHPEHAFLSAQHHKNSKVLLLQSHGTSAFGTVDTLLDEATLGAIYGGDIRLLQVDDHGQQVRFCIPRI